MLCYIDARIFVCNEWSPLIWRPWPITSYSHPLPTLFLAPPPPPLPFRFPLFSSSSVFLLSLFLFSHAYHCFAWGFLNSQVSPVSLPMPLSLSPHISFTHYSLWVCHHLFYLSHYIDTVLTKHCHHKRHHLAGEQFSEIKCHFCPCFARHLAFPRWWMYVCRNCLASGSKLTHCERNNTTINSPCVC